MAEIQAALSAKFLQVANAHKPAANDAGDATGASATFFGVLKSQLSKHVESADSTVLELSLATGMPEETLRGAADMLARATDIQAPEGALRQISDSVDALSAEPLSDMPLPVTTTASQDTEDPPVAQAAADSLLVTGLRPDIPAGQTVSFASMSHKTSADMPEKSAVSAKSGGLIKAGGAAMAAVSGQSLPPPGLAQQAPAGPGGAPVVDAKSEALLATILSPQAGARGDAGVAAPLNGSAPIALTHSFEQVLRQAETKINATIEAPLRSPAFATELSEKVVWLVGRQGQFADLSLNPPHLGSLEVRLSMAGGEASAQFFSNNPIVREAIDAALPRLRELMAQAGINLGEAEVRDQAFDGRQSADARARDRSVDGDISSNQVAMAGMNHIRPDGSGLVDLYI
jgi:flagellar hook-length control protein FliK